MKPKPHLPHRAHIPIGPETADLLASAIYDESGEYIGAMVVDEAFRHSSEYREFWAKLNRGEYQAAEYRRIGKGGKEVWIQASYNPIPGKDGKPYKVVKYATDVTPARAASIVAFKRHAAAEKS